MKYQLTNLCMSASGKTTSNVCLTTYYALWIFLVWDNLGEPVPEETFTNSHLSWSSIILYLLHPSNTIHGILPVQFTCLTVFFHNLVPST